MNLYLVRHAEAIERSKEVREEDRFLTEAGRTSFRLNAKRMAKKKKIPDVIITSPLVRAVQTAEILSEAVAFEGLLTVSGEMAGLNQAGLQRILASYKGKRSLALVGHEPDLGVVAGALLGLPKPLQLKKGMIACLKLAPSAKSKKASLKWLIFEGKKVDISEIIAADEKAKSRSKKK